MLKHRLEGRDHESVEEEGRSSPFAFPESSIGPQNRGAEFQVETWADLTERDRGAKCTKDNELVASPRSSSKNSEESKEMILTGLWINFS